MEILPVSGESGVFLPLRVLSVDLALQDIQEMEPAKVAAHTVALTVLVSLE